MPGNRTWLRVQKIPNADNQACRYPNSANVVCQDCHGNLAQVGDDFSGGLPTGKGLDLAKRVLWASEPLCQSRLTGDVLQPNHPASAIVASDGLRLLQAWQPGDASALLSTKIHAH